jgi:class 3 adenylate cyclase
LAVEPHLAPLSAESYCQTGQQLLKTGAPLMAYDTLAEGLQHHPTDVRLRQLLALALARAGASRLATPILMQLVSEGHTDEETIGLLARTHKDLWSEALDPGESLRHLRLAFHYYQDAYERSAGYWSGINAATTALLLGDRARAASLARRVRTRALELWNEDHSRGDAYWLLATMGEAALLLESWNEAEDWYSQAGALGRRRIGDLVSTRRNARLIVEHLEKDSAPLDACFRIPRVVVFSGHLIDRPGRAHPRFPSALEAAVRDAIGAQVRALDIGFGYASAGCGGDILFLESLAEVNAEGHIVLPYNREAFKADSVDIVSGADWGVRFDRLLETAAEVVTASEQRIGAGGMSYEYGFLMLDGAAGVKADELDTDLVCLALWDGEPGDGPGGTASSIERWRRAGRRVEIIDVAAMVRTGVPSVEADTAATAADEITDDAGGARARFEPEIVGLLFADARGFSKLTEREIPLFVDHLLGSVASELARSARPALFANTWGDGVYLVFRDARDAGEFALRLCEAVRRMDWKAKGFTHDLSLRIGLHAGPAYPGIDPVTGRLSYIGAHVSRAARIEPITPPGEVYASGAFAALARADDVREFVCGYVGQTPLAKGYGTYPTYVVRRRRLKDD